MRGQTRVSLSFTAEGIERPAGQQGKASGGLMMFGRRKCTRCNRLRAACVCESVGRRHRKQDARAHAAAVRRQPGQPVASVVQLRHAHPGWQMRLGHLREVRIGRR
jgi:hypothetical protein